MDISFRMLIHERVESEEERAVLSCANFIIDLSNRLSPDTDIVTVESNPKGRVQNPGAAEHSLANWNAGSVGCNPSTGTDELGK